METRKFTSILSKMIDRTMVGTHKLTDFTPGSAIRSLLEAVAFEVEQFYILTKENIYWGIQEGIIESFDFKRRQARKAYGNVTLRFYNPIEADYIIPRGTTFTSTNQAYPYQFETLVEYRIPKDSTEVTLEVFSKQVGSSSNIPENTLNVMTSAPPSLRSVSNDLSFNTGTDLESLEDFKKRFQDFVETRGRATNKSVRYGAMQVPDIEGVYVHEQVGLVTVYAHDRNGNLSDTLRKNIEIELEDYRPSGIMLRVMPVTKTLKDISVQVTLSNKERISETLQKHIEQVIRTYLNNLKVSDDLILNDLIQAIMNIDDRLIYDVEFSTIHGNTLTRPEEIIRAGNINVTLV